MVRGGCRVEWGGVGWGRVGWSGVGRGGLGRGPSPLPLTHSLSPLLEEETDTSPFKVLASPPPSFYNLTPSTS